MNSTILRIIVLGFLFSILASPTVAYHLGPPEDNNGKATAVYGCTCHGVGGPLNGQPSDRAIVSVSGVPIQYETNTSYDLVIKVQDSNTLAGESGNVAGGFLMSSGDIGLFSWNESEDIRPAVGTPDQDSTTTSTIHNISQSDVDNDGVWNIVWSSPTDDVGGVVFHVAGNSINDNDQADDGDFWNVLSFSINPPGTITNSGDSESLATRTVSVGTYQNLFVAEITEEQLEEEMQLELSSEVFMKGNIYYWSSLIMLILGAVIQREVMERKRGESPEFLASELAYPQMLKFSTVAALLFYLGVMMKSNDSSIVIWGSSLFCSLWASYGVYRTWLAMNSEPTPDDIM
ncbi:MAG TPA: choice-of-anchor V domain-containing protein [Candidatus Thalassarchaeaceae archaeon]|nr:choice-of-anchor V domain-containing protein [Candidatus Thalassarchaeaceae archaeon]